MTNTIPLCEPYLGGNERRYVLDALDCNEPCSGPYVERFERAVADYLGVRHAVAVSSGTAALHLALLAAGVGPGDEVIVPSLTFIATANAVRYCGAEPVFVDVDPETWTMDPGRAICFIQARMIRRKRIILVPVLLLGHPVAMDKKLSEAEYRSLSEWANLASARVILDATEGLGARIKAKKEWQPATTGSRIACLSFNGNKLLTTGGGGMVVTDDASLAEHIRYLANQGTNDAYEHIHSEVGYNYRMSNVAAAIGLAQMERLDEHLAAKRQIAHRYNSELVDVPGITLPREAPWARSAWWMYSVSVRAEEFGMDSRELGRRLRERGIESRHIFQPLHLSPAYRDRQHAPCPVAERIWREAISLPCSVGLTAEQQGRVIEAIREIGGKK